MTKIMKILEGNCKKNVRISLCFHNWAKDKWKELLSKKFIAPETIKRRNLVKRFEIQKLNFPQRFIFLLPCGFGLILSIMMVDLNDRINHSFFIKPFFYLHLIFIISFFSLSTYSLQSFLFSFVIYSFSFIIYTSFSVLLR